MERGPDRRTGGDRRHHRELLVSWELPEWDRHEWRGRERRVGERRSGADRRRPVPPPGEIRYYSDEWARAHGVPDFKAWVEHCTH